MAGRGITESGWKVQARTDIRWRTSSGEGGEINRNGSKHSEGQLGEQRTREVDGLGETEVRGKCQAHKTKRKNNLNKSEGISVTRLSQSQ